MDSADLSLNLSREMLQHDRQLKKIASHLEKKIKSELEALLADDRKTYLEFYDYLMNCDNFFKIKDRNAIDCLGHENGTYSSTYHGFYFDKNDEHNYNFKISANYKKKSKFY